MMTLSRRVILRDLNLRTYHQVIVFVRRALFQNRVEVFDPPIHAMPEHLLLLLRQVHFESRLVIPAWLVLFLLGLILTLKAALL